MRLIKWPEFGEGERRREWGKEKIRVPQTHAQACILIEK
jgi:hypothetical protein